MEEDGRALDVGRWTSAAMGTRRWTWALGTSTGRGQAHGTLRRWTLRREDGSGHRTAHTA